MKKGRYGEELMPRIECYGGLATRFDIQKNKP